MNEGEVGCGIKKGRDRRARKEKGKGKEEMGGEEMRRGHGTTLLERGRIRRGLAVGSRTDLESRIMPRPCWNFWGPYWPHQPCLRMII